MGSEINWNQLKVEYLSSNISLRRLADSHGMNRSTVLSYARRHQWRKDKVKMHTAVDTAIDQRLVDLQVDAAVSKVEKMDRMVDDLFDRTAQAILDLDKRFINGEVVSVPISAKDIRSLTSALKDLAEITGYISSDDSDDGEMTGVVILPEIMIPQEDESM